MFANTLFTLTLLSTSVITALSIPSPHDSLDRRQNINANNQQTLVLPSSGLPAPANLTLKYVALGLGTQNYSCIIPTTTASSTPTITATTTASVNVNIAAKSKSTTTPPAYSTTTTASPTLTPSAIGALATLHDATSLLSRPTTNLTTAIPSLACIANTLSYSLGLPVLGHHYFTSTGTPTFDLKAVDALLSAKKLADVPAPPTSDGEGGCVGREGQGPVDWLMLGDDGTGRSFGGLKAVYRVEVAGGKSLGCEGVEVGEVVTSDYAAEYWFYG